MIRPAFRAASTAVLVFLCFCSAAIPRNNAATLPAYKTDDKKRALQALNRLTFGPRPGDVDRVISIGVDKWIDQQLHPEFIDDQALDARLTPFLTLRMSISELAENLPSPDMIRRVASEEKGIRAASQKGVDRPEDKQTEQEENGDKANNVDSAKAETSADEEMSQMLVVPAEQRLQALLRMPEEEQGNFIASLRGKRREQFLQGMSQIDRGTVIAMMDPRQVVAADLRQSKILRATYSERQLLEVMTDFWMNHFNVFIDKGVDHYELTSYERDVIRPRALGNFEDLLVATAQSPAMLFYLDNWLSVGPKSESAAGGQSGSNEHLLRSSLSATPDQQPKRRHLGLNENYGRELLELHTLGVDGGYTQKDVTEVAKVFSGWTVQLPRKGGGFRFDERMHEPGTKTVLGHEIKENGEKEGYEVLHILASHPSTAKFISRKIATRFVADNPPQAVVDRMAETFLKTHGDIREVLKTMLQSPEFWAPESYRAKVKTPLEFVISVLRATDAEITNANVLANQLRILGMPLYGEPAPKGYSMQADAWVSSAALLGRMNFALRLASGRISGVQLPSSSALMGNQIEDPEKALAQLENALLAGDVSKQTQDIISKHLNDPVVSHRKLDDPIRPPDFAVLEGLLLGSPEFQRR
jgi:uncharacterized protein (DUF1800 family)